MTQLPDLDSLSISSDSFTINSNASDFQDFDDSLTKSSEVDQP